LNQQNQKGKDHKVTDRGQVKVQGMPVGSKRVPESRFQVDKNFYIKEEINGPANGKDHQPEQKLHKKIIEQSLHTRSSIFYWSGQKYKFILYANFPESDRLNIILSLHSKDAIPL
jgi:hypothetical protein